MHTHTQLRGYLLFFRDFIINVFLIHAFLTNPAENLKKKKKKKKIMKNG